MSDLISKCGEFDELDIYYHPLTNRHLGLARVVFSSVRGATTCIDKYNGKSVMGRVSLSSIICDRLNSREPKLSQTNIFLGPQRLSRHIRRAVQDSNRRLHDIKEAAAICSDSSARAHGAAIRHNSIAQHLRRGQEA